MYPKDSYAVYLDSGSDVNMDKDYTHIKAILNEALNAYARNEGIMKREKGARQVCIQPESYVPLRQAVARQ